MPRKKTDSTSKLSRSHQELSPLLLPWLQLSHHNQSLVRPRNHSVRFIINRLLGITFLKPYGSTAPATPSILTHHHSDSFFSSPPRTTCSNHFASSLPIKCGLSSCIQCFPGPIFTLLAFFNVSRYRLANSSPMVIPGVA